MKLLPGDEISYEVFYLEMRTSPKFQWPKKPSEDIFISNSVKPSSRYFFDLYKAVGGDYEWTDKFELPTSEIDFFLCHPLVRMFTFFKDGWTAGFFMLDYRVTGICDLAYFGLVPEAIGFGYGKYMLKVAVKVQQLQTLTRGMTEVQKYIEEQIVEKKYLIGQKFGGHNSRKFSLVPKIMSAKFLSNKVRNRKQSKVVNQIFKKKNKKRR